MHIDIIENNIFRLRIPFEGFTTSVYVYICEHGIALIDCATYESDVDNYILPAVEELNLSLGDVKYIMISHAHRDHIGGLKRLSEFFPDARICTACNIDLPKLNLVDNMPIIGNLKAIALPGHTDDSFGFFDTQSGTLLSTDCLQLDGVDKYRNGISDFKLYSESIEKLKNMNIKRIVAAHDYIPLGSVVEGEAAVKRYLNKCIELARSKQTI